MVIQYGGLRCSVTCVTTSSSNDSVASPTLITSFNRRMQDVTWLVFVKIFWTRITSMFFLGRHYHRICHQLSIYGMNSVDMFATVKINRMGITNKAISTKFLSIIIRTNHGHTEIVIQYGGLRSSVTCVSTSCSNDSFAPPTHRTNQSLDKGLWDVVLLVHKCVMSRSCCSVSGGFWRWRTRLPSAVVAARGGHTRYWTPQTSILHDNFYPSMICSDNDVEDFFWYCLICYAHNNLNYTICTSYLGVKAKFDQLGNSLMSPSS
jgi:hypothetical protein